MPESRAAGDAIGIRPCSGTIGADISGLDMSKAPSALQVDTLQEALS